ncbi:MAG: NAD-dependent epimerase/dehydratase family protein [Dehalococcoidia bacterium]|jgi:nucleoside-diphosphate-sugar epimerase|nr:NAD-dependent epimerase/dehydratase family protein [Dehalococcoidia bacterium]
MKRALIVGGTGPTGPPIAAGLLERGFEVSIYHRGAHETDALPEVHHHLHGDPNSREELEADFGASSWDVVLSMYGRLRYVAEVMVGRCERLIAIGGKGGNVPPSQLPFPRGRGFPIDERHPRFTERSGESTTGWAVAETERGVMARHEAGDLRATVFRYTDIYGPRVPRQWLWPVVRRVLDGRPHIVVPGDGSTLRTMCYVDNAARQVLLAVDREASAGEVFHVVDRETFMLRDVLRIVAEALDHEWEIVGITHPLATAFATSYATPSQQFDTSKLQRMLGYEDAIPPAEAIAHTARWLAEHRDELDEKQLGVLSPNPYAYEDEDRLIAQYRSWVDAASASITAPTVSPALGPRFRSQFGGGSGVAEED